MIRLILIVFSVLICIGCQNENGNTIQVPIDIDDGIKVSTPAKHGFNMELLSELNADLYNEKYGNIHSLLIMNDDEIIFEQYYREGNRNEIHFIASVTKSFTSLLTGIAIEKGYIDSINQPFLDYFPNYKATERDERKHQVTIEHLLTMTSGFDWDEETLPYSNPNNDGVRMDQMDNWLDASLRLKMDTIPGTKYVYCGPNDIILGEIIRNTSKKNIAEFAEEHLFKPLGINEYIWKSKNGIYETGGGLFIKSRDLLKFSHLYLNKGVFDNISIVSKDWIDLTFTPRIEIASPFYMGYHWKIGKPEDELLVYHMNGNGGQIVSIVPALNMIIVMTADNRNQKRPLGPLMERITKIHPDYETKITTPNNVYKK